MPNHILTETEQKFFAEFFSRLETRKLPFVLIRNYANFPKQIGNDLDIFFRRKDTLHAARIFSEVLATYGGQIIHVHRRDYFVAVWFKIDLDVADILHLDFYHGAFTWHGLPYLSERGLLGSAGGFQNFSVPRPAHEAMSLFLASILWGGFFKERYAERIKELLALPGERDELHLQLRKQFGEPGIRIFEKCLSQNCEANEIKLFANELRQRLKRRHIIHNAPLALFRWARHWVAEAGTIWRPPGLHVEIDGDRSVSVPDLQLFSRLPFGEVRLVNSRSRLKNFLKIRIGKAQNCLMLDTSEGKSPNADVSIRNDGHLLPEKLCDAVMQKLSKQNHRFP